MARWLPFALVAWPGFLIAAAQDTAEIITAALLLGALTCYLCGRLGPYFLFAAGAMLTRETSAPVFLGIFLIEAWRALRSRHDWRSAALAGLALVPVLTWSVFGLLRWHDLPHSLSDNNDLTLPLAGVARLVWTNIVGGRVWNADPIANALTRGYVVVTMLALVGFAVTVMCTMPRLLRTPRLTGPLVGWLFMTAVLSVLSDRDPLIEPRSYFRVFSEFWVTGCLLAAHLPAAQRLTRPWLMAGVVVAVDVDLMMWRWLMTLLVH